MTEESTPPANDEFEHADEGVAHAVSHCVPASQPDSVQEIAPPILSAYTVDGGHVHLIGCHLERVPVVRIAAADMSETAAGTKEPIARYFVFDGDDSAGAEASTDLLRKLGLANVLPTKRPGSVSPARVEEVVQRALAAADISKDDVANWQVSIIWCKQVEGKLEFTIGSATQELAFDGWAATLKAPAYHCGVTGAETFHLAATTDGRIIAAEQLEACESSGDLLPCHELIDCDATGMRIAGHLATRCPASGATVKTEAMVECSMCHQRVSPSSLSMERCTTCRTLAPVRRDDSRLDMILGKYPELARWQWLSLSESETAYVLVASGWWQRWLLVIDRTSGDLLHAARGRRFSGDWTPILDAHAEPEF